MVSWSADGSGLLLTDSAGGVTMWALASPDNPDTGADGDDGGAGRAAGSRDAAGSESQQPASPWRAVWRGSCGHAQHAAEAGAGAFDLAATAGSQPSAALVWAPSGGRAAARLLALPHPSAVLGLSWRPAAAHAGCSALLTWGGDGIGRVWARADDAGRLSFWQAAVIPMAAPLRSPPAWVCSAPDASDRPAPSDDSPCAEAGPAAAGAWVAAAGLDGSLRVWAVLGLDDPAPRPTPRAFLFLHCIGALP